MCLLPVDVLGQSLETIRKKGGLGGLGGLGGVMESLCLLMRVTYYC